MKGVEMLHVNLKIDYSVEEGQILDGLINIAFTVAEQDLNVSRDDNDER